MHNAFHALKNAFWDNNGNVSCAVWFFFAEKYKFELKMLILHTRVAFSR